jgi:hypothetical protein
MDLVIELKISNPTDWAMLQHLLHRLKIPFVQKVPTALPDSSISTIATQLPPFFKGEQPTIMDVWSPFDAYDAADILLQAMKTNPNQIKP